MQIKMTKLAKLCLKQSVNANTKGPIMITIRHCLKNNVPRKSQY